MNAVLLQIIKLLANIILSPISFAVEVLAIYLCLGLSATNFVKYADGVVSGISVAACYIVFCYRSEAARQFMGRHSFVFNFGWVFGASFVLGFGSYFFDYFLLKFFMNDQKTIGTLTTFHS